MKKNKCRMLNFNSIDDNRGSLTSIESDSDIPITIKRIFYMHHMKGDRGGHAHKDTDQVIIPASGSFKVKLYDGQTTNYYELNDCTKGLYVPRLTFTDLYDFTPDAVCLVLANTYYDMEKSIRDIDSFEIYVNKNK